MALTTHLSANELYTGTCEIKFSGTSSLRDFSGHVTSPSFKVIVDKKNGELVANWDTVVSVKKMNTSNSLQDSKMYEMFDYLKHPLIKGNFTRFNLSKLPKHSKKPITFPFTITIMKKKKVIDATITDWKVTDSKITFTLKFPILLSDFKLKPPSLFGMVKVGNEVTIKSKFKLIKQHS